MKTLKEKLLVRGPKILGDQKICAGDQIATCPQGFFSKVEPWQCRHFKIKPQEGKAILNSGDPALGESKIAPLVRKQNS